MKKKVVFTGISLLIFSACSSSTTLDNSSESKSSATASELEDVAVSASKDGYLQTDDEISQGRSESYAKSYGITIDEAGRRLDRMPELKNILNEIEEAEEKRVAGKSIVHEPEFGGWIYLTGDQKASDATQKIIEDQDDIQIQYGASHSRKELEEAVDSFRLLQGLSKETRASVTSTGLNLQENSIVVSIESADPAEIKRVQQILNVNNQVSIIVEHGKRSVAQPG